MSTQELDSNDLHGRQVVITRPVGGATALARQVRRRGGRVLRLPALALRAVEPELARTALGRALQAEVWIFTSPAAVRLAARLLPLPPRGPAIAVGTATAAALRRAGVKAPLVPDQQDSEGVLALPHWQERLHASVALIGAAGGRGLLQQALRARGIEVFEAHLYQRVGARLDRRHTQALASLESDALVLWSSATALQQLHDRLPAPLWQRLNDAIAVVSSSRLHDAAAQAGFGRIVQARSALARDLLDAAAQARW